MTITDSMGCVHFDSAFVNQPSNNLSLSLSTSNYNGYAISCFGGNNGEIYANANGGTGSLTYSWGNDTITNLTEGVYSLTITDSMGCSLTDSVYLSSPNPLNSSYSQTNVLCNGDSTGTAIVIFSGGVTDYLLSWTSYTYPLINGLNTFVTPVGVPAGIYPYSVTDINGCMHFDTITITEPTAITVSSSTTNVSCNGGNDGTATLTASGGSGTLTPNWGSNNPTALSAGTYTYTITDANLCIDSGSVTINEPDTLHLNLYATHLSCYNACDGEITSQVSGGVYPYHYSWSNGDTSNNISSLCSGIYSLNAVDQNGCSIFNSISLSEPSEIIISIDSIINASVYNGNDGAIYISPSGGVGNNYSYIWNGPNGYTSFNDDISSLYSGDYIITISDSANCFAVDTIFVSQPSSLSISLDSSINLLCFGECNGELYITADGGDSVYTYLWTGPNGFTSTDEDLDSLCYGTYELMLSDTTESIYMTFTITQPAELNIITSADTALCYGGTAQANAYCYGGQYPYQTIWSNGDTSLITYLNAGAHYVNVIDGNGCSTIDSVIILQNDSMTIGSNSLDVSCYGLSNGSVEINVLSGGSAPYMYSNDNGQNFQSDSTFVNLAPGTSTYVIMDANGCTSVFSTTISEPQELVTSISSTDVSCYGSCDGTAIAIINGGTPPYTENWGALDQDSLCAGLVNLIVQDNNNCLSTTSIVITEPNPIIVSITAINNILNANTGFMFYQWLDENGDPILGATSSSLIANSQGQYAVEVTDSNFCTETSEYINLIIESIDEVNNNNIVVYPNPTQGWATIEIKDHLNGKMQIINTVGEVISIIHHDELYDKKEIINLTNYSKGVYIIQLINNQTIINHKLILQ